MPPKATISSAGRAGEDEDAVGEHEPVAAVGELARQVAVAGDDRRQAREVGVGGVGGEDQDRRRWRTAGPRRRGAVAEHRAAHLRRSPSRSSLGYGCEVVREHRDAEEQRAEDHAHPHERRRPRSSTPGWRNAGTPLEIASTPVSATAPDEKPCRSRKSAERAAGAAAGALGRARRRTGSGSRSPKNDAVQAVARRARRGSTM